MPARSTLVPRLLTVLSLALPLLAMAQISPSALTAAEERAQREAERVFSVIKFHTIRSKPATDAGAGKSRPPAPPAARADPPAPAAPATATVATQAAASVTPSPAITEAGTLTPQATEPASSTWQAPPVVAAQAEEPTSTVPSAAAEQDAGDDEPDEAPLRMQHFVAPVLTAAVEATLGAGSRNVRVRFTVQPDGRVSQAEAAAGVPRRLARPATEAILQWKFAPLPQARTADVDIAFRRD
jgi:TonB family protein